MCECYFFVKQKTAYEMRISDWSSDVCSSDLSMPKIILITGGAGFIGSHLADDLLQHGYRVRVLDNLSPQVHADAAPPAYLCGDVELIRGDIRDAGTLRRALKGVDAVFPLAAMVGVGQSKYHHAAYPAVHDLGPAALLHQP